VKNGHRIPPTQERLGESGLSFHQIAQVVLAKLRTLS
jgi:hypothetical protein